MSVSSSIGPLDNEFFEIVTRCKLCKEIFEDNKQWQQHCRSEKHHKSVAQYAKEKEDEDLFKRIRNEQQKIEKRLEEEAKKSIQSGIQREQQKTRRCLEKEELEKTQQPSLFRKTVPSVFKDRPAHPVCEADRGARSSIFSLPVEDHKRPSDTSVVHLVSTEVGFKSKLLSGWQRSGVSNQGSPSTTSQPQTGVDVTRTPDPGMQARTSLPKLASPREPLRAHRALFTVDKPHAVSGGSVFPRLQSPNNKTPQAFYMPPRSTQLVSSERFQTRKRRSDETGPSDFHFRLDTSTSDVNTASYSSSTPPASYRTDNNEGGKLFVLKEKHAFLQQDDSEHSRAAPSPPLRKKMRVNGQWKNEPTIIISSDSDSNREEHSSSACDWSKVENEDTFDIHPDTQEYDEYLEEPSSTTGVATRRHMDRRQSKANDPKVFPPKSNLFTVVSVWKSRAAGSSSSCDTTQSSKFSFKKGTNPNC